MSKVLVTGGCGYIGSHTVIDLLEQGHEVISIDNGINSEIDPTIDRIFQITGSKIINHKVDLCDFEDTNSVFDLYKNIDTIIHFAALKSVGDSVTDPLGYFHNNVTGLINLLKAAEAHGVSSFIFSSSCTVYGEADVIPVTETTVWKPAASPYGRSKQICELILEDFNKASQMNIAALRYFNPAGAHDSIKIGESPSQKAQNLVPVITETAIGKRASMTVFGQNYDTRDGSCIRDYIHIMDLADAHTKAMIFLQKHTSRGILEVFNLGTGNGVTVLEAISAFEEVSKSKLNYILGEPREGDVVSIYADYKKAEMLLQWNPKRGIKDIMDSAWKWELARNKK